MKIEPLGDTAFIARDLSAPAWQIADAWRQMRLPGVREVVAAYDTVALYTDAGFDPDTLKEGAAPSAPQALEPRAIIEVPVRYDGPDLDEVASRMDLSVAEVVAAHAGSVYTCYAVGFCPGFPYLGYLDESFEKLGRRSEPRVRVPAGSVAVAGRQTGIYPLERPGGWWLIGTTDFQVVDLERGFFAFAPGDRVRFVAG